MTSLPKRGDRVRVTEFRADRGRKFPLSNPVELTEDSRDVGDGFVAFTCRAPKGRDVLLDAVKVEILQRAGKRGWLVEGLRDVAENATAEERRRVAEHPSGFIPSSHNDTRSQSSGSPAVHPEFARGMRRAVEIARKLEAELDQYDWFSVGELSEAVEKELADD